MVSEPLHISKKRWWTSNFLASLLLTGVTLYLYLPGIDTYFIGESWDVLEQVSTPGTSFFSTTSPGGNYLCRRPLRTFILYMSYNTFGLNPLPVQLLTLLLHISCTIFAFFIISKLTQDKLIGFGVALLFSVHWTNCEPVRRLEGQPEVLKGFFAMITIVAFHYYRERHSYLYYTVALLSLVFCFVSLESAVTLPFMLLAIDIYYKHINIDIRNLLKGPLSNVKSLKLAELLLHLPFISVSLIYILILIFMPTATETKLCQFGSGTILKGLEDHMIYLFTIPLVIDSSYLFRIATMVLALVIFVYFTSCSEEEKTRILFLFFCLIILILPYLVKGGFSTRYGYSPSIITLTILILLVRDGSRQLLQTFSHTTAVVRRFHFLLVFIFCFTFFLLDVRFVRNHLKYYKELGMINQSFVNAVRHSFTEDVKDYTIICVNFPNVVDPGYGPNFGLTRLYLGQKESMIAVLLGRRNWGTTKEVYFSQKNNYTDIALFCGQAINPEEYNQITRGVDKKVFLFCPLDKAVVEVTGRPYAEVDVIAKGDHSLKNIPSNHKK